MISLSRNPASLKLMYEKYEQAYQEALYAFKTGGNEGFGAAVVSPYNYLPAWGYGTGGGELYEGYPVDRLERRY